VRFPRGNFASDGEGAKEKTPRENLPRGSSQIEADANVSVPASFDFHYARRPDRHLIVLAMVQADGVARHVPGRCYVPKRELARNYFASLQNFA
jgi:hypothetical protein